jgi:hypothetical protein
LMRAMLSRKDFYLVATSLLTCKVGNIDCIDY